MKNKLQNTNKSNPNQANNSLLDEANQELVALAPNVTTEDRIKAKEICAEITIIQYLKGRGKNLGMAIKLLEFFRERVAENKKRIKDIA